MKNLLLSLLLLLQGVSVPGNQSGIVEGRVLVIDGKPAVGVRVSAEMASDTGAPLSEPSIMASIVQTDATGHFRLERIPPGRYYITVGLVDFPTYYPGVTGLGDAEVLAVTGGAVLSGIDFSMARPTGLKVSGRVVREGNQPAIANQRVLISGNRPPNQNVLLPPDGSFEFINVPPGTYTIGLSPANGSQAQRIVVDDKDVQVDIMAPLVFTVTGRLVVENDGARPRLALAFVNGTNRVSSSIASNGTYSVQLPEGNYRISPNGLPTGFNMKSMVSGSTDLLTEPLKVTADTSPQFVVTLGVVSPPPWVRVKGHVGSGVTGVGVSMTSSSAGEILQATVNPDGTFEFPKVLSGTYTARLTGGAAPGAIPPATLNVGDTNIDNWEIDLPAMATISGHITMEGEAVSQLRGPILRFSFSNTGAGPSTLSSVVGVNGSFNLILPEGSHQISLLNPPAGYNVKSMTYGSVNLLTNPLNVDPKDIRNELNLILEPSATATWFKVSLRLAGHIQSSEITRINLLGGGGGTWESTLNSAGAFEFSRVPPGNYTARIFAGDRGIDVAVPVVVTSKDVTDIEVRFPSQKETIGHLALETGNAIQPRFWLTLTGANTVTIYTSVEKDGTFKARLPDGEWRVSVGGLPADLTLKAFTYGDTDLMRNSLKVTAADAPEMKMTMAASNSASWVKVSGRFIAPKLEGALAAQFRAATTTMSLMGPAKFETALNPDGTFEFPKVLPSTYTWCCNFGYTSITIPKHDVSNLIIRSITGRVFLEEGLQQPGIYVQANDGSGTSAASVQQDGSFVLIVPEGNYRVSMSALPADFYVKSIRYGSTELVNQTLNVLPGQDTSALQLTIARRP